MIKGFHDSNRITPGGYFSMEVEAIDALIAANKQLEKHRQKLEQMRPGAYCIHRSWGFGQIQNYDLASERLIIDFEDGKTSHPMAPAFCVDKLEILEDEHILAKSRATEAEVKEMIDKEPVEIVVSILKEKPDMQASTIEIERILSYLIPSDKKRKRWWTDTKKLLIKDPRIAVPAKKTEPYILRDEEVTPEDEILESFYATKQSKQKILFAEKLFQLSKDKSELKKDLDAVLKTLTQAIRDTKMLSQADRLHGIWVRNDLARDDSTESEVETLEPTSFSIIEESADRLDQLASDLPSGYYQRFLDLLTRVYPDRWEDVVIKLLRHSEGKFTAECISFLFEKGKNELVISCFERWLLEQTMRGPILLWVVKNRRSQKYSQLVQPMMTPRLLNAVFYAIDSESLQNSGNRRIPLADALSDDFELIPELLDKGSPENARDLAQALMLNQGFDDLTKKSLLARFIRKFPAIQSLVDRGEATEVAEADQSLTVSIASFNRAKAEYDELIKVKIPENKIAIEVAKEHGDLKENSEYKMARQDQDTFLARKAELERDLGRARVTDFTEVSREAVGIGSVVGLRQGEGEDIQKFAILGAWDSDPDQNILSYLTPLGQSLMAKKVGEEVETNIAGVKERWKIESIERWVDRAV